MRQKYEIIGITDVMLHLELMLHELIEFVHVDVHKKLGGEVAQRKAGSKAADNTLQKPERVCVRNVLVQDAHAHGVVDGSKELPNIALQYPAGASVVLRNFVCE